MQMNVIPLLTMFAVRLDLNIIVSPSHDSFDHVNTLEIVCNWFTVILTCWLQTSDEHCRFNSVPAATEICPGEHTGKGR